MKHMIICLLAALLLIGCTPQHQPDTENTLWVITEQSTSDGMNYQAKETAETIEAEHPNAVVRIDIIPVDETEREIYLQQLRTQIMAGSGPDVYLLPAGKELIMDSPESDDTISVAVEPLFHDVEQTMRLGVFADIESLYCEDIELNTTGLHQKIMDAGVVEGKRYVLPLRYTTPVLLANTSAGSVGETLPDTLTNLIEGALDTNNEAMLAGLQMPADTSMIPALYDYDKGAICVSPEEIAQYMKLYQQWYASAVGTQKKLIEAAEIENTEFYNAEFQGAFDNILDQLKISITFESFNSVEDYVLCDTNWTKSGLPYYATSISGALEGAFLKEAMNTNTDMYPMGRMDGSIGAEITYWGAVGANTENKALAYEYLRLFLTEEYQWDAIRPKKNQSDGLIENSWPVRAVGATSHLYRTLEYQLTNVSAGISCNKERLTHIRAGVSEITDEDMPILQVPIDEVRFPFYQPYEETLEYALTLLNKENGTPTNVEIDKLAGEVYQYLWWHLAEG